MRLETLFLTSPCTALMETFLLRTSVEAKWMGEPRKVDAFRIRMKTIERSGLSFLSPFLMTVRAGWLLNQGRNGVGLRGMASLSCWFSQVSKYFNDRAKCPNTLTTYLLNLKTPFLRWQHQWSLDWLFVLFGFSNNTQEFIVELTLCIMWLATNVLAIFYWYVSWF